MKLLDVHSHILPCVDDGAKNLDESLKLLGELKKQGVTDIIATPHFSPADESFNEYKKKVAVAKEHLLAAVSGLDLPDIYFGQEILYSYRLGNFEGIRNLTIENTNYLLLEFGFIKFDDTVCRDIMKMRDEWDVFPIIAHIERYKSFKGYKNLLELIKSGYCKAQVNAGSVVDGYYTHTIDVLFKKKYVSYIGSDCHSAKNRPPKIAEAYERIEKRYGKDAVAAIIEKSERLLGQLKA